jgi:hypothetical protein
MYRSDFDRALRLRRLIGAYPCDEEANKIAGRIPLGQGAVLLHVHEIVQFHERQRREKIEAGTC